ncbi:hypothetical protein N9Z48_02585 [Euryarchaeota archaeon]|nr:hypothetical protein [Candidatus Poseidoniaceae archaeon]MDB2560605.1 hypothetical protein [Euryarchaeota archaeon]
MSTENSDADATIVSMLLNPSRTMANWYAGIGIFGIFLAVLNIIGMVHPTYHLSWGGLFTFEAMNAAFEPKSDGVQVVLSDFIFIGLCIALAGLGIRTFGNDESGIAGWFKSILVNDTWPALVDPDIGGWNKLFGAWSVLLGIIFYFYYGIANTGWIDVGVYSVSIALIAFGLGLLMAANAPEGDDNLD